MEGVEIGGGEEEKKTGNGGSLNLENNILPPILFEF